MSDQNSFYKQLVERYVANRATSEELEVFFYLLEQGKLNDILEARMNEDAGITDAEPYMVPAAPAAIIPLNRKRRMFTWVAAAVGVLIAGAAWWWFARTPVTQQQQTLAVQNDILPGVNQATLTLEDGSEMQLDSIGSRKIQQGGIAVTTSNGSLVYQNKSISGAQRYNTLTTRKGQQYRLTLSDGTKIIADASTSIRFPVAFTGTDRVVEINGHAWLEVAADASRPFFVKKGNHTVQVLGTSFDFNAWDNEKDMTVTLVSGSVQVKKGAAACLLQPGQQAVADGANITLIKNADIEQATAWINGKMIFRQADIGTIMRAVERWYDIEVEMQGTPDSRDFYFAVNRSAPLSELLHFLDVYHIRYKLDPFTRKLILMQ